MTVSSLPRTIFRKAQVCGEAALCALPGTGIDFDRFWRGGEYLGFLEQQGFVIESSEPLPAIIPVMYVEAKKADIMGDDSSIAGEAQETKHSRHSTARLD
ncbi:MAG: hypothetical protein QM270_07960 [Bacillota bacterium]|nr:hypothetical protein [Bacillota bacterium]